MSQHHDALDVLELIPARVVPDAVSWECPCSTILLLLLLQLEVCSLTSPKISFSSAKPQYPGKMGWGRGDLNLSLYIKQ